MTTPNDPTPATAGALFEVFQLLSDKIEEKHKNMRETVEDVLHRIEQRLDAHDKEDRETQNRVLTMETERKAERSELGREKTRMIRDTDIRVMWISLLVSGLVPLIIFGFGRLFPAGH